VNAGFGSLSVFAGGILPAHEAVMSNPLNAKLNPICHLLALLGAHHILHISRIRVKNVGAMPQFFVCI